VEVIGWWSGSFGSTDNNLVADPIAKVSIQDLTLRGGADFSRLAIPRAAEMLAV
jgi:hypothetical protein